MSFDDIMAIGDVMRPSYGFEAFGRFFAVTIPREKAIEIIRRKDEFCKETGSDGSFFQVVEISKYLKYSDRVFLYLNCDGDNGFPHPCKDTE